MKKTEVRRTSSYDEVVEACYRINASDPSGKTWGQVQHTFGAGGKPWYIITVCEYDAEEVLTREIIE